VSAAPGRCHTTVIATAASSPQVAGGVPPGAENSEPAAPGGKGGGR